MKVVIALDKFKGSLDAPTACETVRRAIASVRDDLDVVVLPMADGGEGTAAAMIRARGGVWIPATVAGPLPGRRVRAGFAWFPKERAAVVEMAAASGLALLRRQEYDPLRSTTRGTGELLRVAAERGARKIWLAVGGSATVDGGVGAAAALGWQFLSAAGKLVGPGGGELARIARILPPAKRCWPDIEVLCDVDNPLCGARGAARVFGPQKGATPSMVEELEAGLCHLARLASRQLGREMLRLAGGGAAGGLSAGAAVFLGARLVKGAETIIRVTGLKAAIEDADWVITGEGRFDEQSLAGKVVSGVSALARQTGAKVAVLAGAVALPARRYRAAGIEVAMGLCRRGTSRREALARPRQLLCARAREFATRHFP